MFNNIFGTESEEAIDDHALVAKARSGQFREARDLLRHYPDQINLNAVGLDNQTPLMWAASDGQPDMAELILKLNDEKPGRLDFNKTNTRGWTATMITGAANSTDSLEMLLKYKYDRDHCELDLSRTDRKGRNICHLIAEAGATEAARSLLDFVEEVDLELNVNSKNDEEKTAIEVAASNENNEITSLLSDHVTR